MKIFYIDEGINSIVIDDFYSEYQLHDIFDELQNITINKALTEDHKHLYSAEKEGRSIAKKYGGWIEDDNSVLIKYPKENFSSLFERIVSLNSMYSLLFHMNNRYHLLSYYQNGGYYDKHTDSCVFTVLNYFQKEPKQYTGGELILHSVNGVNTVKIEPKNNRVVIIPSCIVHEVTEVKMDTDDINGGGRYCLSIFLDHQYMKETI